MTKNININSATGDIELNIDLTNYELSRLEENLIKFNKDVPEEKKLTLKEYISIVLDVSLIEKELNSKYNYLNILKKEVKELENDLKNKYSIGLTGSEEVFNEVIELRKKTLKDSSNYTKNYRLDYIDLLVNHIENIVHGFDKQYEDAIITLKEDLTGDAKKNQSDVIEAIHIAKYNLNPNDTTYKQQLKSLEGFKKYVDSF